MGFRDSFGLTAEQSNRLVWDIKKYYIKSLEAKTLDGFREKPSTELRLFCFKPISIQQMDWDGLTNALKHGVQEVVDIIHPNSPFQIYFPWR